MFDWFIEVDRAKVNGEFLWLYAILFILFIWGGCNWKPFVPGRRLKNCWCLECYSVGDHSIPCPAVVDRKRVWWEYFWLAIQTRINSYWRHSLSGFLYAQLPLFYFFPLHLCLSKEKFSVLSKIFLCCSLSLHLSLSLSLSPLALYLSCVGYCIFVVKRTDIYGVVFMARTDIYGVVLYGSLFFKNLWRCLFFVLLLLIRKRIN